MAMATIRSASNTTTFFQSFPSENYKTISASDMNKALSPIFSTTQEKNLHLDEDGEIGIFGADKYFNGGMDVETPIPITKETIKFHYRKTQQQKLDLSPIKPQIHHYGTPSVRSQSSVNSQSALLQIRQETPSRARPKKVQSKSFLSNLGSKCSCCNKNSVNVDENIGEISYNKNSNLNPHSRKPTKAITEPNSWFEAMEIQKVNKLSNGLYRENCFTFPIKQEEEEKQRKSVEVFGSELSANDVDSDASSDLFEIESLKLNKSRQPSDETSQTTTTCYAPSEASIEWSVVTASVADFSVMSDYEEQKPSTAKSKTNKDIQQKKSGVYLGCKSQKAVGVAEMCIGRMRE